MALNKQIHIYSVDTSAFYKNRERKLHNKLNNLYNFRKKLKDRINKTKDENLKNKMEICLKTINNSIKYFKNKLTKMLSKNIMIRNLDSKYLNKYNVVSVFDSVLTRTMKVPINTLITDIMIVQTYFFDVIEDIILDGYIYNGEKYVCLTASAGQIRTKKTVFIKESILLKHQNTLMCGLTIKDINDYGGVNINKYLAYLALCNSATDVWEDFDISKVIVVDDMELVVRGIVDFIDDKTYDIIRKEMDVLINHTDGIGMILPSKSKKNFMVRLPWIKGLLVSFPFDKFINEANENSTGTHYGMVTDIFNKKHDIIKDGIEVIFTKSQFKMFKYYHTWKQYTDNFVKFDCQAGICNLEEDTFSNAKINYQMLQTLVDMTDEEIKKIALKTKNDIARLGCDRKTMLKILGVTKSNINKNYFQQALEIYPQLLCDTYSKEILKQTKKSMVKHARAGKLEIKGKYTFIIPDLYFFCEYLFLKNKKPEGLLKDGEVYCNLYKDVSKLDCLRSPHLYREHAIRNNVIDDKKEKWFTTNGLYTSCHDLISKILQFDVDGDKSLVCADETLVSVAERNMKEIVPLFYNMIKASAELVNNKSIFNGLKLAYTGGNIGMKSNDITKIWNSEKINEEAIKAIKLLCMENNFVIDYAKTLYKPDRPADKKKLITVYTNNKTPHFFIYAKDKEKDKVEPINKSVVNRLEKIIKNPRIIFNTKDIGKFNYKMLMSNENIDLDEDIIKKYTELDLKSHFMINENKDEEISNEVYLYQTIKNKLLEINCDIGYITDVLVKYLYIQKNSSYKTTLWECFGDIIVNNLKNNIKLGNIYCDKCGDLVEKTAKNKKYCEDCAKEIQFNQKKKWDKTRKNNKNPKSLE